MTLQEKIDAAWKSGLPWIADDDYPTVPLEQMNRLLKEMFSDGYRAALRGLYVDLDLNMSECQEFEFYWIRTDDGWRNAMRVDFGFDVVSASGQDLDFSCGQEDVRRIVDVNIPHPSEVFGE